MKIHIWKIAVLFSVFLIALSFTGSKVRAAEISTIDIKINMKWDDEEDLDGSRPEEVTVTLYANGNEIGRSVTLRADEDWEGTFIELPLYYNGELQSYSVVEEKVDGFFSKSRKHSRLLLNNLLYPCPAGVASTGGKVSLSEACRFTEIKKPHRSAAFQVILSLSIRTHEGYLKILRTKNPRCLFLCRFTYSHCWISSGRA